MYDFRGTRLTGIRDLQDIYLGGTGVILASGPTFTAYPQTQVPPGWIRFSINETIRTVGAHADYWVLSDEPIVLRYAKHCPLTTRILAMHRSSQLIPKACPHHFVRTVNSMDQVQDYKNGYEFFSRKTVVIGAVEMARYMGLTRIFIFGMDFFRTFAAYYYDGQESMNGMERSSDPRHEVPGALHEGKRIFQTPALMAARDMLRGVRRAGLWSKLSIYVVGSPNSQQDVVPKMTLEDFLKLAKQQEVPVGT